MNLDWVDRPLERAGQVVAEAEDGAPASRGTRSAVVLPGPGGYPLVGATAIGHWQARSPVDPAATPVAAEEELESPVSEPTSPPVAVPNDVASTITTEPAPDTGPPGVRTRRVLGISVSSGLGLAAVLTLNAVLSDPIAGYDYLASRLDRPASDRDRGPRKRPS
jgi:hypothetical protein